MEWIAAAIIFVALLYLFPRAVGWTLVLAVVIALGAGALYWWQYYVEEAEVAKVVPTFQADAGTTRCKPEFPLFLGFVNGSTRTIKSINFGVTIRRKGYSGEIGNFAAVTQDKILAPGEEFGLCYAVPTLSVPTAQGDLELEPSHKWVSWN